MEITNLKFCIFIKRNSRRLYIDNKLANPEPVQIASTTQAYLSGLGISRPQSIEEGFGFVPPEIFSIENLSSTNNIILLSIGGIMIGFGAR